MFHKSEKRKEGERGYVLILALMVLCFGTLIIIPTLNHVNTGLLSTRVSKEHLYKHYANDGAVEYSLWLLTYNVDGIVDSLNMTDPGYATTVTLNGIEVPISIEIALSGVGGEPGPLPPTESGIHLEAVLEVEPSWAPAGEYTDFQFTVHARNYGESRVGLKGLLLILAPNFEYIDGSYAGPEGEFTQTWVTDHWELLWDFTTPLPKVESESSYPIPFGIRGFLETGAHADFGTGYIYYSAWGEQVVLQAGNLLDNIAIGLYDITASGTMFRILASAGIYETGTGLNSYQIEY